MYYPKNAICQCIFIPKFLMLNPYYLIHMKMGLLAAAKAALTPPEK